jgi:hypothetical protein
MIKKYTNQSGLELCWVSTAKRREQVLAAGAWVGVVCMGNSGGGMMDSLLVVHDKPGLQFEVTLDGHRAYLAYMDLGKQTLDIYRTFVPANLRGRGVAAALTEAALDYAKSMDYTVIPSCSYVERYMQRAERNQARNA